MAAPCLHCAIAELIRDHCQKHPDMIVNEKPAADIVAIVEHLAKVVGETASMAPVALRGAIVCRAFVTALRSAGLEASFTMGDAPGAAPVNETAH